MSENLLDATIAKLYRLPLYFHKDETVGGLMTRTGRGAPALAPARARGGVARREV